MNNLDNIATDLENLAADLREIDDQQSENAADLENERDEAKAKLTDVRHLLLESYYGWHLKARLTCTQAADPDHDETCPRCGVEALRPGMDVVLDKIREVLL